MGYGSIALSIWVPCLVQAKLIAHLLTSYLVVSILVAAQEIHQGTYVVSQVVGYNAPRLHQASKVPPPPEGPFSIQNILENSARLPNVFN